jgi:hypothetical protein
MSGKRNRAISRMVSQISEGKQNVNYRTTRNNLKKMLSDVTKRGNVDHIEQMNEDIRLFSKDSEHRSPLF